MENNVLAGWDSLLNRMQNKEAADNTTPAFNYDVFLIETTKLFIEQSTDYNDRYLVGLIEGHAPTLWRWEVSKKLDRLRTWLKRGELQVKDEGIRNSVDGIFIYTVQYIAYVQNIVNYVKDPELFLSVTREDRKHFFEFYSKQYKPEEIVEFLVKKDLIQEREVVLQLLIQFYMGATIPTEEWRRAIKELLR